MNTTLSLNSEILRQLSYVGDDTATLNKVLAYIKNLVKSADSANKDMLEDAATWREMGLAPEAADSAAQSVKEYNNGEFAFKGTAAEAVEFLNSL